jgi:hypothetical protein
MNSRNKELIHALEMATPDFFLYHPFKLELPNFNRHDGVPPCSDCPNFGMTTGETAVRVKFERGSGCAAPAARIRRHLSAALIAFHGAYDTIWSATRVTFNGIPASNFSNLFKRVR